MWLETFAEKSRFFNKMGFLTEPILKIRNFSIFYDQACPEN